MQRQLFDTLLQLGNFLVFLLQNLREVRDDNSQSFFLFCLNSLFNLGFCEQGLILHDLRIHSLGSFGFDLLPGLDAQDQNN